MRSLILILTTLLLTKSLLAEEKSSFYIITHHENKVESLTQKELVQLFMGKKINLNGVNVKIILHNDREFFIQKVLKMSVQKFERTWKRLIFTGQRKGYTSVATDQEISETVALHENTIGFIKSKKYLNDSMRVISIK